MPRSPRTGNINHEYLCWGTLTSLGAMDKQEVRVYDYVDHNVPVLARMFVKQLKGYRTMGYVADAEEHSAVENLTRSI